MKSIAPRTFKKGKVSFKPKAKAPQKKNHLLDARRYQSLFENAVEGFYINTPAGKFEEVNPSFAKMLGYASPDQMLQEVTDIASQLYVHSGQRKIFQGLLKKNGYVRKIEFQAKKRDGKVIWLSVCARTVRDDKNNVLYYEGYAEDITKHKTFEKEIDKMQRSLVRQMHQIDRTNADLEHVAQAISNDLKAPLHNISSYLSGVLSNQIGLSSENKENISTALAGATKMKSLMDGLIAYSDLKIEDCMKEEVPLQAVVERVIQRLDSQIHERGAQLKVSALPSIWGVSIELERVFEALLTNALQYCRKGAPCNISVRAVPKENYWLFEVEDNGRGIDEKYKTTLFNIFHRVGKLSHASELGSGMGLALSRKIVELHGGRIWFNSNLGKGTIFTFSLPSL